MKVIALVFITVAPACLALYTSRDDVVELTSANFQTRVINSDEIWVVEFYAPWCGHCKNLVPEYKKAATALKGIIKVGAVDMTQHQSVGAPYNVQGFPTIKIFGADKKKPTDYNGARTAQAITDSVLSEAKRVVSGRLSGRSTGDSGSSGGSRGGSGGGNDVIELTDSNFEKLVLNSKDVWLVEFFAPWCGHCKNLEPHWKAAASELKGKVKLGALDATVHTVMANKFGVRGFPTIKYFAPGSDASDAVDYDGGRTTSDIVSWASAKALENLPAPEVVEATNQQIVEDQCKEKQLCIFAFLPHILDCQSKCRNDYLAILRELGDKFKKNGWGWIWVEGGAQPELEEAFGIGGFGYPAMAAMNYRKMKFAMLKGSFGKDGINEFLRDLSYGKGQTAPVKGATFPKIIKKDPWDGKDGQLPVEEEIDLSDVDLDRTEL
ncbi:protein disulfide-isomerase domain protein [Necator americanus]|uniref:Protein disulfide-isomerase A6 homolog n=1 Tax=Necator americanus TaxID=51031 RepID=W2TE41_NECAM|nr:protein disulfide-isomerase domain protein [Necator americanus]ETN79262.1 protein disulfide-isomerase domain protein [Necator americanus]